MIAAVDILVVDMTNSLGTAAAHTKVAVHHTTAAAQKICTGIHILKHRPLETISCVRLRRLRRESRSYARRTQAHLGPHVRRPADPVTVRMHAHVD